MNLEASSTVVILARGDRCEPTEAVPSTIRKGGLHGSVCTKGDVILSALSNVLARDRVGVTVRSVASVSSDCCDEKECAEREDVAELSSWESRICCARCMSRLCIFNEGRCSNFILRAAAMEPICRS